MRNATELKLSETSAARAGLQVTNAGSGFVTPDEASPRPKGPARIAEIGLLSPGQLISTKELSQRWDIPESTLRYWRCAGTGPPYVKLGGRIKYDLADVDRYIRANKRMPSVRAHGR
jgi:hypothetical protein